MGLIFPDDVDAWRRWHNGRTPIRRLFRGVRELSSDPRFQLYIGGNRPKILLVLDDTHASSLGPPCSPRWTTSTPLRSPSSRRWEAERMLPQRPW